jgi:hypothetical protein
MKRVLGLLAVTVLCVVLGTAFVSAAGSATVSYSVTVQLLSVSITPASVDIGTVAAGGFSVPSTSIAVTNNGNIAEKFALNGANSADWTLTTATAALTSTQYGLRAMFSDPQENLGAFNEGDHALTSTPVSASATKFATSGSDGIAVPANGVRFLQIVFYAPSGTPTLAQQTVSLTVTAQAN